MPSPFLFLLLQKNVSLSVKVESILITKTGMRWLQKERNIGKEEGKKIKECYESYSSWLHRLKRLTKQFEFAYSTPVDKRKEEELEKRKKKKYSKKVHEKCNGQPANVARDGAHAYSGTCILVAHGPWGPAGSADMSCFFIYCSSSSSSPRLATLASIDQSV